METFDILDRTIFSVGTWNGDKWSKIDLENAVKAFNDTKGKLRPPLKLGHNDEQKLTDGFPAIGWVENLRLVGKDLVADFKKVPKVIYELLNAGAYRTVSAEFWQNATIDGEEYPFLFKGLALLGADLPAVDSVSDIVDMYKIDDKTMVKQYEVEIKNNEKSEDNMEKEELIAKVAELEANLKTASDNHATDKETWETTNKENETKLEEANNSIGEYETKNKEIEAEKVKTEYTVRIDKLIEDKKLMPVQKDVALELVINAPKELKFTEGEEEITYSEKLFNLLSNNPEVKINTDENSEKVEPKELDEVATIEKYAKDNKVSYKEALIAIQNKG